MILSPPKLLGCRFLILENRFGTRKMKRYCYQKKFQYFFESLPAKKILMRFSGKSEKGTLENERRFNGGLDH